VTCAPDEAGNFPGRRLQADKLGQYEIAMSAQCNEINRRFLVATG
jgi:hypothetical protein